MASMSACGGVPWFSAAFTKDMNRIVISPSGLVSDLGAAPLSIYTSNNDRQIRHGRTLPRASIVAAAIVSSADFHEASELSRGPLASQEKELGQEFSFG